MPATIWPRRNRLITVGMSRTPPPYRERRAAPRPAQPHRFHFPPTLIRLSALLLFLSAPAEPPTSPRRVAASPRAGSAKGIHSLRRGAENQRFAVVRNNFRKNYDFLKKTYFEEK